MVWMPTSDPECEAVEINHKEISQSDFITFGVLLNLKTTLLKLTL